MGKTRHNLAYTTIISFVCNIDFSKNGLSTDDRLRSQRTSKPYKIKVNNCKFCDFLIRIKKKKKKKGLFKLKTFDIILGNASNFYSMMLKFSEKFGYPFSDVFIFGNMFPESHGFLIFIIFLFFYLRFSNFLRNSAIHFRLFLYLETCFTVWLLCRLQAVS